jgi:hypothetical protein
MASMRNTAALPALGIALLTVSCASAPERITHSPKAQKELADALAGRTAGQPVQCLPSYRAASNMQVIDDWTILFRDGRTVYLQTPRGGCPGVSSFGNTLVTRLQGNSQLCNGDINHVVDVQSRIGGGSCVFGPFVPYTKP